MMKANEIVEVKDTGVSVTVDEEITVVLSRTYQFEGKEISQLDFSGMENVTADNLIKANKMAAAAGAAAILPEQDLYHTLLIGAEVTGLPIEFFKQLKARDAIKVKNMVTSFLFGEA